MHDESTDEPDPASGTEFGSVQSENYFNHFETTPASSVASNATPSVTGRKVVVVGGGISGLRTASVLKRHGVDVVILEARDRLGGRMLTRRVPGKVPREIGAAWMHETSQNPLVAMIPKLNIEYYYDDGAPLYYTPYGRASSQFKAKKVAEEFADYCAWFYETHPDAPDRSAQEFVEDYVQNHVLLSKEERTWAPSALREMELWTSINNNVASSKFLSYYITERNLYVTGGYDKLPQFYAKPLIRDGHIRLNTVVQTIDTSGEKAKITTATGEVYEADAVVCTLPLGVLKRNMVQFVPPLGEQFSEALQNYSYGCLGKFFFEFDEVFWPKDNDQIIYFPRSDQDPGILGNALVISNLLLVAGVTELCIQTSEFLTRKLETMSDEEIYEYFVPLFKLLQTEPYNELPNLVSLEHTQWSKDKYAGFGTYSAVKVGDNPYLFYDYLEHHRDSKLQFAGEHCVSIGNGCVHGAFMSGENAAINLLDQLGIPFDGDSTPAASPR